MKLITLKLSVLVPALILALVSHCWAHPPCSEAKKVLILNSYHNGLGWTDSIVDSIAKTFEDSDLEIDLNIEYMDTKRSFDDEYFQKLRELYRIKYSGKKFDLIISSDDHAFSFLIENRDEIFGPVPIVFCGVNYLESYNILPGSNITGVVESFDVVSTLKTALSLSPHAQKIYIINDTTKTGMANRIIIEKALQIIKPSQQAVFLQNIEINALESYLQNIERNNIVLLMSYTSDGAGHTFSYEQIGKIVSQNSNAPVYGVWDFYLGCGIVGGMLTSGHSQGQAAADMALKILTGEKPQNIKMTLKSPNKYLFDYGPLCRFGIDPKALPPQSEIINRPVSFYAKHKYVIYVSGLVITHLVFVICVLAANIIRRKRVEEELKKHRDNLEDTVNKRTEKLQQANEGLAYEIRNREIAEQELILTQRKLLDIIEFLPDPTFVVDSEGMVIAWNRAIENMTGVEKKDIIGESKDEYSKIFYGTVRPLLIDMICEPDEKLAKKYNTFTRKDNTLFTELYLPGLYGGKGAYVWATASALFDEAGNRIGAIESIRDVTEWKRSEHALINLNEKLEKSIEHVNMIAAEAEIANQTKSDFLANMSHEIRTPMNAIVGFSDLLAGENLTEEQQEYVNAISKSSETLLKIIDDILDFSKIETGSFDVDIKRCPVQEILDTVASILKTSADSKNIEFRINTTEQIPQNIYSDPDRVKQCLVNLGGNAIKFTEKGHVYINVSTENQNNKQFIRFDVEDTGIGIEEKHKAKIFESFSQADTSSTRKFGGTGLGLAITRQITKLLGARLEFSSQPGKGSVFSLIVPVGLGMDLLSDSEQDNEYMRFQQSSYGTLQGKVLLAEDKPSNQRLIEVLLKHYGLEYETVADGKAAFEAVMNGDFDLVLMDIQMPVMSGIEAAKAIRKAGVEIPIIAITANAMKGDEQKCIQAGCSMYLPKPVNKDEILKALKELLPQSAQSK